MADMNVSESNRKARSVRTDHIERNILLTLILVGAAEVSVLVWLFS
jgi:hypothetical protein